MNAKKILCLVLALVMALSAVACGKKEPVATEPAATAPAADPAAPVEYVDPFAEYADDYDALSSAVYDEVLGEFLANYEKAQAATLLRAVITL